MNKETYGKSSSWISIRSLKEESEIGFVYSEKAFTGLKDCTSPQSEASVTLELRPNTETNESVILGNSHKNYLETNTEETKDSYLCSKEISLLINEIYTKDTKYVKMLNMYEKHVKNLDSEIRFLKLSLTTSQKEVERLSFLLETIKKEHALNIQTLQSRHEKKIIKMKQDQNQFSDLRLNTSPLFKLQKINERHLEEIQKLQTHHNKKIQQVTQKLLNQTNHKPPTNPAPLPSTLRPNRSSSLSTPEKSPISTPKPILQSLKPSNPLHCNS